MNCTSTCCSNINKLQDPPNAPVQQEESSSKSPTTQPTPSPLTQPTVTNVLGTDSPSSSDENSNIDSDYYTGPTQTLPTQFGDLPNYIPTHMDVSIASVFDGEHLRDNDGTQLDGGIKEDKVWQDRHRLLTTCSLNIYDLPSGPVGRSFIKSLCLEINGVIERQWNFEKVLCYVSTMLQQSPDAKGTPSIRQRIKTRLQDWKEGKHNVLISSTIISAEVLMKRK